MINPKLNIKKASREQGHKCMNNKFGQRNQPNIKTTLAKNNTRVLSLLMFFETINNPKKALKVLSCVIYKITSNNVFIGYLAFEYIFKVNYLLVLEGSLNTKKKLWQNIRNWNFRFVNELNVLSWIFEKQKLCCHIGIY